MSHDKLYDSTALLEYTEFPQHKSLIGVQVWGLYDHALSGKYADVSYFRVTLREICFGGAQPVEVVNKTAIEMTNRVIESLDTAIEELLQHRVRMVEALEQLQAQGIQLFDEASKSMEGGQQP